MKYNRRLLLVPSFLQIRHKILKKYKIVVNNNNLDRSSMTNNLTFY